MYEPLEAEGVGYAIRLPANPILWDTSPVGDRRTRCDAIRLRRLSGAELGRVTSRRGRGRMASGRAVSARLSQGHRHLLKSARHVRAMEGKNAIKWETAVTHLRQFGAPPTSYARVQLGQFHGDTGDAEEDGAMVAAQPAREADENLRQS